MATYSSSSSTNSIAVSAAAWTSRTRSATSSTSDTPSRSTSSAVQPSGVRARAAAKYDTYVLRDKRLTGGIQDPSERWAHPDPLCDHGEHLIRPQVDIV